MEKRLTRSDYLFALLFLFMLICVAAAFFLGMKTGEGKAEAKYGWLIQAGGLESESSHYSQQHLASFYHTIYVPYIDFEKNWFERKADLEQGTATNPSAVFKELAGIADQSYTTIAAVNLPASSPLLQEAQGHFLDSLKLFREGAEQIRAVAKSATNATLANHMDQGREFAEAKNYAIRAQHAYFEAISAWYQSAFPSTVFMTYTNQPELSLDQWKPLSLVAKSVYISEWMKVNRAYVNYTPQDLVSRIDEFIDTQQARQLQMDSVASIAQLLHSTEAVRDGDFSKRKTKRYGKETLPRLLFFE